MSKVAVVILSDTDGGEALGRVVNALTAAQEYKEGGDTVKLIFTEAGTKWVSELSSPGHKLRDLFTSLKRQIEGACGYCAGAFGVSAEVESCGVRLLEDYGSNMSYRKLTSEGFQVLTF